MDSNIDLAEQMSQLHKDFGLLSDLFEVSKVCNQVTEVNSLSKGLAEILFNKLNLLDITVFVEDKGEFVSLFSLGSDSSSDYTFKNQNEGIWQLLQENQLIYLLNENGENVHKLFFEKYNLSRLHSTYWIPIIYQGEIKSIISIGLKPENHKLVPNQETFIVRFAQDVAPVFNKFMQQRDNEDRMTYLQKNLHNMSILYNIGQAMNFIDDLKGLLKVVLEKALVTLEAEKGSLMLYDYATNDLIVKVVYGLPDKEIEDKINEGLTECTRIPVGEGIAGSVFLTKEPIITNLGNNDPRFIQSNQSNVDSILCLPLIVKNESIGVINITNKRQGKFFDKNDLDFMKAVANQAAIAIDNAQLYELATKDGLTKLYIYRHFKTLLENEFKRSQRYKHPVSLLMLDIDNFKQVNDIYGHRTGDTVLKEVAAIIEQSCRKVDYPSRYGGEEFAVILPETTAKNSCIIAERIRSRVNDLIVSKDLNTQISPTISIGIAEYPEHAKDQDELVEFADQALYHAKKAGKNKVSLYSKDGCLFPTPRK